MGRGGGNAIGPDAGYAHTAATGGTRAEQKQTAATGRQEAPMKSIVIVATLVAVLVGMGVMAYAARSAASAGPTAEASRGLSPSGAIAAPDEVVVGDRYIVPALPATVLDRLPATEAVGDRYLAERMALADLVVGERILAAEDLANAYVHELPGFTEVLLADGFRQAGDGTWFYDLYSSWMRFPLNR